MLTAGTLFSQWGINTTLVDHFTDKPICDLMEINRLMELYDKIDDPRKLGAFLREQLGLLHYFLLVTGSIRDFDVRKHLNKQKEFFNDALKIIQAIREKIANERKCEDLKDEPFEDVQTVLTNALNYFIDIISLRLKEFKDNNQVFQAALLKAVPELEKFPMPSSPVNGGQI
ncbi:MAG: hypothetical protein AB7F64_08805 [Gammaproteobacteria bacterium]